MYEFSKLTDHFLIEYFPTLVADFGIDAAAGAGLVVFHEACVVVVAGAQLPDRGEAWAVVGFCDVTVLVRIGHPVRLHRVIQFLP